jgi:hypothetical protein
MPRSGGIFTLVPGYFATDGTTIEVSQHNPPLEDIAQALTDSLPRDGSAPMTGNLAMGSNKITNLAAATNPADAVRFDQLPTFTPTTATLTAGTDAQGQGPITTDQVTITTAAANPSGATLPTAVAAKRVIIANRGANPVNIYPATGAAIGALATNAPVLLAVNQSVEFFARSATQWEGQISQPLDADLTAIAALGGTGIAVRTAADTWAQRQIVSADSSVTITNPGGIAGNIDLSVASGGVSAATAASSGTTVDIGSIPATATRVWLLFSAVSLSGTDDLLVQIGDSGGIENTGYISGSRESASSSTAGFVVFVGNAARAAHGVMEIVKGAGNQWFSHHAVYTPTICSAGGGSKTLSDTLTQIRLTRTGTDTLDGSGTITVRWA